MRRVVHMVLALSSLTLLQGCSGPDEQAVDVVVIGARAPALADPAAGPLTVPQQVLVQTVAQGLVRFDARGQIVPGLAERWNVSDDGLSYIFRLASGKWPSGRTVQARDVARLLTRQLRADSRNELRDTLGAVVEVVAMTDRVIEIRLSAPRPNLLQLLAQPEMGLVREGQGSGPFQPDPQQDKPGALALSHVQRVIDGPDLRDHIHLRTAAAAKAIADFKAGEAELVLGGTFDDLPLARDADLGRRALRFDPVTGLFGLVPAKRSGPAADPDIRALLNRAIDRAALIEQLGVPGLTPRATLLQGGLEGLPAPAAPASFSTPFAERRAALVNEANRQFGSLQRPTITVALPEGPGGSIVFNRLAADWGAIGLTVERLPAGRSADFRLVDAVAPSASPAWFVRRFRCAVSPACSEEADELMDSAREAVVGAQRAAFFAEAVRLLEDETVFLPLAAPVRWSLVSPDLPGYAENIVARHPLTGLRDKLSREGQ